MQPSTSHSYRSFLEAKLAISQHSGFAVPAGQYSPHAEAAPARYRALGAAGGRRAVFSTFGLGRIAQMEASL